MSWDVVIGYASGLRLLSPAMDPSTLLRTLLVVHTCDAVMCGLVAANNGYSKTLWSALGLVFGIWALAVIMLLPRRRTVPSDPERAL